MRSEQLADAVRNWQQQLLTGEFDPTCEDLLQMRRTASERKKAKAQVGRISDPTTRLAHPHVSSHLCWETMPCCPTVMPPCHSLR